MTPIDKAIAALEDCDHEPYGQVSKDSAYNFVNAHYETLIEALTSLKAMKESVGDVEAIRRECHIYLSNKIDGDFGCEDAKIGASTGINMTIDYFVSHGLLAKQSDEVDGKIIYDLLYDEEDTVMRRRYAERIANYFSDNSSQRGLLQTQGEGE